MARTASPFCRRDRTPCVSWRRRNPRQTRNFLPNPTKALSESRPGQPTGVTKGSPDFVMTANLSEATRSSCPRHRDPPAPALAVSAPPPGTPEIPAPAESCTLDGDPRSPDRESCDVRRRTRPSLSAAVRAKRDAKRVTAVPNLAWRSRSRRPRQTLAPAISFDIGSPIRSAIARTSRSPM